MTSRLQALIAYRLCHGSDDEFAQGPEIDFTAVAVVGAFVEHSLESFVDPNNVVGQPLDCCGNNVAQVRVAERVDVNIAWAQIIVAVA